MKHQYVARDGKVYDTEKECINHEKYLDKLAKERKASREEMDRRWKEVDEAFDKYNDLYDKFVEDYPDRNTSLFDYLFFM